MQEWKSMDLHFLCEVFKSIFRFDNNFFEKSVKVIYKNHSAPQEFKGSNEDKKKKPIETYEDWFNQILLPKQESLFQPCYTFTHQ